MSLDGSEPEADAGDDLMAVGIDIEIARVRAVRIFQTGVAIVRIAIFDLGVGARGQRLLEPDAEAITVEIEVAAGLGRAVAGDQIEAVIGVAALSVDQRPRRRE